MPQDKDMKKIKAIINEAGLSRIWDAVQNHSTGAVTGFRKSDTRSENMRKNKEILAYLKTRGYSVITVKGSYIENFESPNATEVGEQSFFVVNRKVQGDDGGELRSDLIRLGKKYDQDSVLIVPVGGKAAFLFGTSKREDSFPGYGQKSVVGNAKFGKAAGEFFSRIRGRQFAFEEVQMPDTRNGLWAMKKLAEEVARTLPDEAD